MSRRRKANILKFWQSAHADCVELRFDQTGNSLLFHPRYQKLSHGAKHLYHCMSMECAGRAEFSFPQSAAKKYGFASSSFWRYVAELEESQFIEVHSGKNLRVANQYRFIPAWRACS